MELLLCPRPECSGVLFLEDLACRRCGTEIAYHTPSGTMVELSGPDVGIAGSVWHPCANRPWGCNWLVADETHAGRCFSCLLTRRSPDADDTIALEKLSDAAQSKRRLLVQFRTLGLPVDPWFEADGGLGFDLLSSRSENKRVTIGHANGIITIDLVETLDDHRERLRVALGEPYRSMLGHFRHEAGHYYQWILVEQTAWIDECRTLFGDERASYAEAIQRHYRTGAPRGWAESYISEYATMHPWEDFAECFAHYLHITDTLNTAAAGGLELAPARHGIAGLHQVVQPRPRYGPDDFAPMLEDWRWLSMFFNRVNRAMGKGDLYPFTLTAPVLEKLAFVHRVITALPGWQEDPTDGFRRRARMPA